MERLNPSRCCSVCLRLFPLMSHYGLKAQVYCDIPEHWLMVGLDPACVLAEWQAKDDEHATDRARLREAADRLQAPLESPEPQAPSPAAPTDTQAATELDDAEVQARFLRMLGWLDDPPSGTAA